MKHYILMPFFLEHHKDGEIYTRKGLDREKKSQYVFTVMLEEKRPSTKIVSGLILPRQLF